MKAQIQKIKLAFRKMKRFVFVHLILVRKNSYTTNKLCSMETRVLYIAKHVNKDVPLESNESVSLVLSTE